MQALARRLATASRGPWPDRPVPVTLVITELDVGGAERALVALATGLDRRRWQPSVIGLGPEGPLAGPLRAAGVETECLDVPRGAPVRAVLRLAGALRRRGPRLVQSFLFHANIASRLAAPLAGRPWVVGGLRVAERARRWHLSMDRGTERLAAGAVCVSRGVARFSREQAGLDPARLIVIPNGVDPARFERAEAVPRAALGVSEGSFLILYVGRLDPQKGLPILLDAADRLSTSDRDWTLLLVGDGPERDWLLGQLANRPALAGRVRWLGRRDDVPGLLHTADLLVLPSLWEGMPNVVLEAMAARRAVVATAIEGCEDLVIPGATGWLVPPGDAPALAEALHAAESDRPRLLRYGAAGRARVESGYSVARMVDSYERLWAGLLGLEFGPERD